MLRYIILGLILAGLFQVFFWITQDNRVTLKQDASERIESLSYSPYKGYDKKVLSGMLKTGLNSDRLSFNVLKRTVISLFNAFNKKIR